MRIDAHQHFWIYNPIRDAWIDETMQKIKRDFLPNDLHPILKSNKIDGCIAVQADESEEESLFLMNLASENDFIKGVVGWLDFFDPNLESKLNTFSQNNKFKGLRHILQAKPDGYMLHPKFQKGLSKLEKFGLTYDILVYERQLLEAIKLVESFPNQRFVLNHIGKPKISLGLDERWVSNIIELSKHENLYCKISGMVTETENKIWQTSDFYPFIDTVVKAFGVDRIMFGSDWPVNLLAADYNEVLGIVESFFKGSSQNDFDKIMGLNAQQFYQI